MTTVTHHVGIACKDPIALEKWYVKHFGFQRVRVVPLGKEQIVFLKSGSFYLEVFQAKGESPEPPHTGAGPDYSSWRHLAFAVDDVDAKIREMGKDARVTAGPMSFDDFIKGWRGAWIADPEGHIVELAQGYKDDPNPPACPS